MSQKLKISDTGLKLIKAFEGYRPVDRELVTGQRIVGYGHRLYSHDAVIMNKTEAEEVLRSDLEPFEDMINTEVHAPITQSQFDALCSFAFNIGPKAFLKSDTLRALNNGRPLDAANGLDVWRKSEIAGKTYVVDALMRRRTAEKALFLRTERDLAAGREDLPPVKDTTIEGLSTEDAYPVFTEEDAETIVSSAPYSARFSPARRREDGPAGVLQLSELDIIDETDAPESDDLTVLDDATAPNDMADVIDLDSVIELEEEAFLREPDDRVETAEEPSSPIAAAASDIVARLDALIDTVEGGDQDSDLEWPESLIETASPEGDEPVSQAEIIDLDSRASRSEGKVVETFDEAEEVSSVLHSAKKSSMLVIDELAADDAFRRKLDSASKYIESNSAETKAPEPLPQYSLGLWIPILLGFILFGAAGGAMVRGSEALLGAWGPIIAVTGFVIGAALIIAGVYAYLRSLRVINHEYR